MKTKKFIEKVKELGFKVEKVEADENFLEIKNENKVIAYVSISCVFEISTNYLEFTKLFEIKKKQLFDLLIEYSATPIEEREKEKKYYLKHKFLMSNSGDNYLNYRTYFDNWFLNNNTMYKNCRTQFTKQEIEEIKEKFNTSLDDFEIIEVE